MTNAQEVLSILAQITEENESEKKVTVGETQAPSPADEIRTFKDLLDNGLKAMV